MLQCPKNNFGQRDCNIVEFPHQPDVLFCDTCKQHFRRDYSGFNSPFSYINALLLLALVTIIISAVLEDTKQPIRQPYHSPTQQRTSKSN